MIDRVLIFGDSITQGMWDGRGGWVQRLIDDYFAQQMADLTADVPLLFNLGISADTSQHVLERFERETEARLRKNMAFVFAIGTNDACIDGDSPFATPEEYEANLETLIDRAKHFTTKDRILFVGLQPCYEARTNPCFWGDYNYTNERLKLFNESLEGICRQQGVAFVPTFEEFQKRQKTPGDLLTSDGLHPNDAGHQCIYEQVKPALKDLIR